MCTRRHAQKVGLGAATIDESKMRDDMAKSAALEREAAKADQFFQLLGWHHAQPMPGGCDSCRIV